MLGHFAITHIPPLFVTAALTFGGLIPLFDAEFAIREFGLPNQAAISKPAQSLMMTSAGRGTAIGLALTTLYLQGKLIEFDTVLSVLWFVGIIDGYVCWREGVPGRGVFRATSGVVIAAWGLFGLTSRL
ncbi:hypothetical protein N7452_008105 [Penicillium brevicompactum]|uniref:Uncharacterized protein n=1 Tax=Penicillium brevicompactum TaxID=5074 RepID=A0A9W9Q6E1_PENBR|nr:hypothetical protein N7452_008105 [Penicillium brevicompactum]